MFTRDRYHYVHLVISIYITFPIPMQTLMSVSMVTVIIWGRTAHATTQSAIMNVDAWRAIIRIMLHIIASVSC